MPRTPRILFNNAYYHVINRGRNRGVTFRHENDFRKFLGVLKEECIRLNVKVSAYCLMNNHFHLLVKTPEANLSHFMKQVKGKYVQYFNRKYSVDGALFSGRYKAFVIDEENYLLGAIRYIHLNPVKARMVVKPQVYQWSSDRYYRKGGVKSTEWLNINDVLKKYTLSNFSLREAYAKHIAEGVDSRIAKFYASKKRAIILGDSDYCDDIRENYLFGKFKINTCEERKKKGRDMYREVLKKINVQKVLVENDFIPKRQIIYSLMRALTDLQYSEIVDVCEGRSADSVRMDCFRFRQKRENDPLVWQAYQMLLDELLASKGSGQNM